jgi:type I restriction enzyme S subunit
MNPKGLGDANGLPEGWASTTVAAAFDLNPRKAAEGALSDNMPVTFVPMPAVDAETGTIASPQVRPFASVRKGFTSFCENDVIVAKITPCMENGKAAIARGLTNGTGFGSTEFHVLRPNGAAIAEYVYHFVRQESFRREAADQMTGSVGQKRVPPTFFEEAFFPLPPLAEQRRIVAEVDSLLSKLNAARVRLARVLLILKRFRQSVVAAACSGRLTADWREEHPDLEPVSTALSKRAKFVDLHGIRRLIRRGSAGVPDIELPEVPETWAIRSVRQLVESGAIVDFQDGNHGSLYPRMEDFGDEGVRFLTAQQVFDNRVLLEDTPFLKHDKARLLRIGFAKPRDVLLTHNATVGRVALLPQYDGDVILGTSVTYYRTIPDLLLPEFLCFEMQAQLWQNQLRSVMEQTTRNQVSITKQVEFQLLVPPASEQSEIVRRVEFLFHLADRIEQRLRIATVRSEQITQSVLTRAFTGDLVPSEAELARCEGRDYEPASVLLERIRAERESTAAQSQKNGNPQRSRKKVAK